MIVTNKICFKCGQDKPLDEYHFNKNKRINKCKICVGEYVRLWYLNNKEQSKSKRKIWRQKNSERLAKKSNAYYYDNKERLIKQSLEYDTKKRNTCPEYKALKLLRKRMWAALNGQTKAGSSLELLGAPPAHVWEYLRQGFMWTYNRPYSDAESVHVDHIKPCASI